MELKLSRKPYPMCRRTHACSVTTIKRAIARMFDVVVPLAAADVQAATFGCTGVHMKMTADPTLVPLNRLVGTWTTEATHPAMPGVIVHGTAIVEWLEGEHFLIVRSRNDHPDFPDAISIIGEMERDRVESGRGPSVNSQSSWHMHYFDSRGVFRVYETRVTDEAWQWWRDAAGFSQRFTGQFADGGDTIVGCSQLCEDDVHWTDDLAITYRRQE